MSTVTRTRFATTPPGVAASALRASRRHPGSGRIVSFALVLASAVVLVLCYVYTQRDRPISQPRPQPVSNGQGPVAPGPQAGGPGGSAPQSGPQAGGPGGSAPQSGPQTRSDP